MSSYLDQLEKEYATTQAAEGYQMLPDGDYLCLITEAEVRENKNTAGEHLYARLQVSAGDRKGASIYHRRAITAKTLPFVKADAKALGVESLGIAELANRWSQFVGQEVVCRLKTTKNSDGESNQNVYLSSAAPLQQDYVKRLLDSAHQKGFADESIEQMSKAMFQQRGLSQLTTTELKELGYRLKEPRPTPAFDDSDYPF